MSNPSLRVSDTALGSLLAGADPQELAAENPNLDILVMAPPGEGKTYFLGTFPKPLLVQQFDPPNKCLTYGPDGVGYQMGPVKKDEARYCFYREFFNKTTGKLVIRVEFFSETNPRQAHAVENYMARMNDLEKDIAEWGIKTVGLDSITFMESAARWHNQYTFHPSNKRGEELQDGRLHYAASGRFLQEFVMGRYPGLTNLCNVVVLAHITDEKVPTGVTDIAEPRTVVSVPGKNFRKTVAGAYTEVYRLYVDESGRHLLQTQKRPFPNINECKSLRQFSDPCVAHYKALWESKKTKEAKAE